eukprot:10784366-Prorocentrum_lima.AAC.1
MISASSKRQTCVSHSTPEAEYIAGDYAIRAEGLPHLTLWEHILGRMPTLTFAEDNESMIKIVKSGRSQRLAH